MKTSTTPKRSPLAFFILVFALAVPFWVLGALAKPLPPPINLSLSSLQGVSPLIAALILVYRQEKSSGVKRLLKRIIDAKSVKPKIWYVPVIFLLPLIYALSYVVMLLMGWPLPAPDIPWLLIPVLLVVFFLLAACEEVGWTGYATDPLQERWSAFTTAVLLGLVWAVWHVVPALQAHHAWTFIIAQHFFYSVGLRVLIVWVYNNTGTSLFAAILLHAMDNVSYALFPINGSAYDPVVTGAITAVMVAIVTFLWGPKTLARYRWAGRNTVPSETRGR